MRHRHGNGLTLALSASLLFGGCTRQSQGEACATQGNDCQSPLVCVPLPGRTELGKCCAPNTQCSTVAQGFMLNQDADAGSFAGDDAPYDADGPAHDRGPNDANLSDGGSGSDEGGG